MTHSCSVCWHSTEVVDKRGRCPKCAPAPKQKRERKPATTQRVAAAPLDGGKKALAVVVGAVIGIPISITILGLVAMLFPPVLFALPLFIAAGWSMGYNVCMGRKPEVG